MCRPSLHLGIPLTLQAQSGRPSSRSSLHSSGSVGSYANRRQSQINYSGAAKGVVVSTSRTGAARSAAILLISCHISALKSNKFTSSNQVETEFHNHPTPPPPSTQPLLQDQQQSQSKSTAPQLPLGSVTTEIDADPRNGRKPTNTIETGSLDSGSSRLANRAVDNSRQQTANRMYQEMVMARYIDRQLHHQRQLLTLELPEMLQNRSKSLNDRFRRMLGIVDHDILDPLSDLADWRADAKSEESQWEDAEPFEEHDGLRGSAGDLLFDESLSKSCNAHIEVVDALPSPACDTAKFAVIS